MGELGPMRFSPAHHRFVGRLAGSFGLETVPFTTAKSQSILFLRGQRMQMRDVYNGTAGGGGAGAGTGAGSALRERLNITRNPLEAEVMLKLVN